MLDMLTIEANEGASFCFQDLASNSFVIKVCRRKYLVCRGHV